MRTFTSLTVIATLLILLAPSRRAEAFYNVEVVKNGSFELGDNGDWTGSTEAIGRWPPIVWHGGTQGVRIQGDCDLPVCNDTLTLRQTIQLPANANAVTFSAWYRQRIAPLAIAVLNADNPSEVWWNFTLNFGDSQTSWTQLAVDLTAHRGGRAIIRLSGDTLWSPFYAYVDDVSVIADLPDTTAPTSTATLTPPGPAGEQGYYTIPPSISLAASDDAGGSGLQTVLAKWDTDPDFAPSAAPLIAPEGVHTLSFYAQDVAGNREAVQTITVKVDTVSPTATMNYSTTAATTDPVIATLVPAETGVVVTNNGGSLTYTFAANGSFTFTFKDGAGHPGQAVATVNNIGPAATKPILQPTPAPEPSAPTAPVATDVSPPKPTPLVLGAKTFRPVITTIRGRAGAYTLKVGKKIVPLQPFGSLYTDGIMGKRVNFGDRGSVLVFLNTQPAADGAIKLFSTKGKALGTWLPFGVPAAPGLHADIMVQDDGRVYLVVGWATGGRRAQVFRVTPTKLQLVRTLVVSARARGPVAVKFFKARGDRYGLVTMLGGQRGTIRGWTYRAASRTFVIDKTFRTSRVRFAGGAMTLK